MIRRCLAIGIVLCAAVPVAARSELDESWLRVQQALAADARDEVDVRILEFRQTADELGARRLTPYAAALVMWAHDRPAVIGEPVVRRARILDPEYPSSHFLLSRWLWEQGNFFEAARCYLTGWWAVLLFESSRRSLVASIGGWLLLAVGWTLSVAIVLQVLRYFRQIAHDAMELSGTVFRRPNAIVLAVVILCLPIFAGLGPIWLVVYLFALSWAYMGVGQRITAVTTIGMLALLVPSLSGWQIAALRNPSVSDRVAEMLDERRIDPSTLRQFTELEVELDGIASYHLVLGELLRMHGDADRARLQFQKAALLDDGDPTPLIFLGNLSMEEGDIQRGVQRFNAAIELDSRSSLAYHNLSSAFDQSRRFQEGDAARDMARRLSGQAEELGIRGRDPRIQYPRLRSADVARVFDETGSEALVRVSSARFDRNPIGELVEPTSRVFSVMMVFGLLVLVLRMRWMWTAQTCTKCGKVFCPRCKTATESSSYCSQCISVFLKRDVVSIEQQSAKLDQIRRWTTWSTVGRRVASFLVPGSHYLDDQAWLGLIIGVLAWTCLSGALLWAPMTLPSVDPLMAILPVQIILGVIFAALWLRSVVAAWRWR